MLQTHEKEKQKTMKDFKELISNVETEFSEKNKKQLGNNKIHGNLNNPIPQNPNWQKTKLASRICGAQSYGKESIGFECVYILRDGEILPKIRHYNKGAEKGNWIDGKGLTKLLVKWKRHLMPHDKLLVKSYKHRGYKTKESVLSGKSSVDCSWTATVGDFLTYEKAKRWVQKNLVPNGINTYQKFKKNANSLPYNIPKEPDDEYCFCFRHLKRSWKDFFGKKK